MAANYVTITKRDLARGIDAYSARSAVQEGFLEDLLNMDTSPTGKISTRTGYEGYYGWVPLRVSKLVHSGTAVRFYFDSATSIDLTSVSLGPIVAYGKSGGGGSGDWTSSNSSEWYSTFTINNKHALSGTGTATATGADLGWSDDDYWFGLASADTSYNTDNTILIANDYAIDETSYDIDIDYTVASATDAYIFTKDASAASGTVYKDTVSPQTETCDISTIVDSFFPTSGTWTVGTPVEYTGASGSWVDPNLTVGEIYYVTATQNGGSDIQLSTDIAGNNNVDATYDMSGESLTFVSRGVAVPAATHQLDTFNIIPKLYDTSISAGEKTEVIPDEVYIDGSGNFIATVEGGFTGDVYLEAVPTSQTSATTSSVGSNTFSISSPGSPWNFVQAYSYNATISAFEGIILSNVAYDSDNDEIDITYTSSTVEPIEIYWTNAEVASNSIEVTDNSGTSESYTDTDPQLTVWGIDHSGIYKDATSRGGHVTHLDTYTKDGTTNVICGLGGNLFYDLTRTTANAATYDMGTGLVNLQERVEGDQTLTPLFRKATSQFDFIDGDVSVANDTVTETSHGLTTGDTVVLSTTGTVPTGLSTTTVYYIIKVDDDTFKFSSSSDNASSGIPVGISAAAGGGTHTVHVTENSWNYRTRGNIFDTTIRDSKAVVTGVAWSSGTTVDYTLSLSDPSATLAFSTQVDGNDKLTVTGCPNSRHNGTFDITAISGTAAAPVISVTNSAITSDRYDDSGIQGRAGVFTDRITLESSSPFIPDDILVSDFGTGAPTPTVVDSDDSNVVYLQGITGGVEAPDGLILYGKRTTSLIPLRNSAGTAASSGIVPGDMMVISSLDRRTRVLYSTPDPADDDVGTSYSGDGTTMTFSTQQDHGLNIGQKVTIWNASDFGINGTYTVTGIPETDEFEVASTSTDSGNCYVLHNTIELDEELTVQDGGSATTFTVEGRWFPIEAPQDSSQDLVDLYEQRYFDTADYDSQPDLKSVTIGNSLYLTNGSDPVMKYDGTNLYRAGFPRWQPSLFTSRDASVADKIAVTRRVTVNGLNTNEGTIEIDAPIVNVGDWVQENGQTEGPWLVIDKWTEGTSSTDKYYIKVRTKDTALTGLAAANLLNVTGFYKYYARLNYIDANGNRVASATIQSEDMSLRIHQDARIELKFAGLPNYDNYDYSNLELELYRTDNTGAGPYYFQSRELLSYDASSGYIVIYDSFDDDFIVSSGNRDKALLGTGLYPELGNAWDEPPRATSVTTLSDRLVLGNIKSYPYVDINLTRPSLVEELDASDFNGDTILFRKDGTDTSTGTSMADYVTYEFVTNYTAIVPADTTASGGVVTVSCTTNTPPAVGDWVYMWHNGSQDNNKLDYAGWYQVSARVDSSPNSTFSFKADVPDDGVGDSDNVGRYSTATTSGNVPIYLGDDGNYLDIDAVVGGSWERQAAVRLAKAINATMRVTDTAQETTFRPWLKAEAGNDWALGQLRVTCPIAISTTPEVDITFTNTSTQYWVNDFKVATGEDSAFTEKKFPARIVRSYQNYPELFDNPFDAQTESDSVIDVNAADGQEITAIVPFFGDSATGSDTPLNQELVVFKTNSVYVVNVETRVVKKIDSRGQGCTAPKSVAVTQDGIFFANESGIYRLGRDLRVRRVGAFLERSWDNINSEGINECAGHHYNGGRRYKLSYPTSSSTYNDGVFVYDYEREGKGQEFGAWARYDNHEVTWWANDKQTAYWGSRSGDVFLVRNRGEASDFRDEAQAITSTATLRAEDFGLPGLRKIVHGITSFFELEVTDLTNVSISTDMSMQGSFESSGSISVDRDSLTHQTVRSPLATRRGTHCQVRYSHSTKDEQMVISGVAYEVGQLSSRLVKDTGDI